MLAEFQCSLEKREEDILYKEINRKFNSYIASHPKLIINFEKDIIHAKTSVTIAMGNIKELWPYSVSVRENDGKECYEVYYFTYVDDTYALVPTLSEVADIIVTHFTKFVCETSESKNNHSTDNKKLEARVERLERLCNEAVLERRVSKLESSIDKYLDDPRFDDVMAKARAAKAANYHANDIDGCPPFLRQNEYIYAWVIRNCDVDQLQKVIESGVNVNKRQMSDPWGGCTPLMIAAGLNKTDMVKMLLDAGAKVNLVSDNRDGRTALMYCLAHGFRDNANVTKTVELLLSNGANPNNKDKYDNKPISIADRIGDKKLIKMLLDAGANG